MSSSGTDPAARVLREVVYAERDGFRPLNLDLYLPAPGPDPAPIVVFAHGGGWWRGSRRTVTPGSDAATVFARFTRAGLAVVSVDYRLSGEAPFPAQLEDLRDAVRWTREHAEELGGDARRIVGWGESAGAHLVALLALAPDSGLAGAALWYPPTDLLTLGAQLDPADPERFDRAADTREALLLGGSVADRRSLARAASPALQVRPGAPRFLIAHGEADELVPIAQSEELVEALQGAGVEVGFTRVPGAGHMWAGVPGIEPFVDDVIAFVERVCRIPA